MNDLTNIFRYQKRQVPGDKVTLSVTFAKNDDETLTRLLRAVYNCDPTLYLWDLAEMAGLTYENILILFAKYPDAKA